MQRPRASQVIFSFAGRQSKGRRSTQQMPGEGLDSIPSSHDVVGTRGNESAFNPQSTYTACPECGVRRPDAGLHARVALWDPRRCGLFGEGWHMMVMAREPPNDGVQTARPAPACCSRWIRASGLVGFRRANNALENQSEGEVGKALSHRRKCHVVTSA
jgi:hypothetical protein